MRLNVAPSQKEGHLLIYMMAHKHYLVISIYEKGNSPEGCVEDLG